MSPVGLSLLDRNMLKHPVICLNPAVFVYLNKILKDKRFSYNARKPVAIIL